MIILNSFYSTKIITTGGEGGFITVNDEKYYNRCASISAIGIDKESEKEIYTLAGSNNRMTEFQAIMGIYQLRKLENFVKFWRNSRRSSGCCRKNEWKFVSINVK